MAFVGQDALEKTERSFPISSVDDLQDPKTRGEPAIGVPEGTDLTLVINLDTVRPEDAVRLKAGEFPKKVTFSDGRSVRLIKIPAAIDDEGLTHIDISKLPDQNFLIYLPESYVVATSSSIHREAYPHDSSYVLSALIRHAKISEESDPELSQTYLSMAHDMLDDFAYETEMFGFPLNGNRGYYLTRSQTNNLVTNVWEYYEATGDKKWLKEIGLPMAEAIYRYWNSSNGQVLISAGDQEYEGNRWIAHGTGPCQEVWESHGTHKAYYFRVLDTLIEYSQMENAERPLFAQGFDYDKVIQPINDGEIKGWLTDGSLVSVTVDGGEGMESRMFFLAGSQTESGKDEPVIKYGDHYYTFTPAFYTSDRAARVSGYDNNHLYGPFNAFTSDFVPVAHNVQMYRHAGDIALMHRELGDTTEAEQWKEIAESRKQMIFSAMWDKDRGMLFDYDASEDRLRTEYPFASTGYALWAGLFDVSNPTEKEQMMSLVHFMEENFEGPNGLYASGVETGMHWDKPYVWPIQQGMIVSGLRDYSTELRKIGATDEAKYLTDAADRISLKYLKANYRHWKRSNGEEIQEKVGPDRGVFTGYENGANYTWNLAAVWDLYDGLSPEAKESFHAYVHLKGWD